MSKGIDRRDFLNRGWKAGIVMIGAAGFWTSWDVLRPLPGSGIGGVVSNRVVFFDTQHGQAWVT